MNSRIVLSAVLLFFALAFSTAAADISGQWTATFDTPNGSQHYTYTFKVDGQKLTGTAKSELGENEIQNGTIQGDQVSFVENLNYQGTTYALAYTGKVSDDQIAFTRSVADVNYSDSAVATRVK
jgi:hypothetical protein